MSIKRTRKKYTREFKIEAVRLVTDGGVSIAQASRDLGVDANVLGRWKKELSEDSKHAFPGKGKLKPVTCPRMWHHIRGQVKVLSPEASPKLLLIPRATSPSPIKHVIGLQQFPIMGF